MDQEIGVDRIGTGPYHHHSKEEKDHALYHHLLKEDHPTDTPHPTNLHHLEEEKGLHLQVTEEDMTPHLIDTLEADPHNTEEEVAHLHTIPHH